MENHHMVNIDAHSYVLTINCEHFLSPRYSDPNYKALWLHRIWKSAMRPAEQSQHCASMCFIVRSLECADVVRFNQTVALVGLSCSNGYFYTQCFCNFSYANLAGSRALTARGWFNARLGAACLTEKLISDAERPPLKREWRRPRDNPVN